MTTRRDFLKLLGVGAAAAAVPALARDTGDTATYATQSGPRTVKTYPAYSFNGDIDTGWTLSNDGDLEFTAGGFLVPITDEIMEDVEACQRQAAQYREVLKRCLIDLTI